MAYCVKCGAKVEQCIKCCPQCGADIPGYEEGERQSDTSNDTYRGNTNNENSYYGESQNKNSYNRGNVQHFDAHEAHFLILEIGGLAGRSTS